MAVWDWVVTCVKFVIMGLIYCVTGQVVLAMLYYFLLVGLPLLCLRVYLGGMILSFKSLVLLMTGLDLLGDDCGLGRTDQLDSMSIE